MPTQKERRKVRSVVNKIRKSQGRPTVEEEECNGRPRIVFVAQQIAVLQAKRTSLDVQIEANDQRGEKLQTELDVVDSEQRTYEREMDSLTRSQIVRK